MRDKIYRIMKVANGWILEPYHPEYGPVMSWNDSYVFETSKKLAKFIKKLDDEEKFIEATK